MPTKNPPPLLRQLGAKLRQMRERAGLNIKETAPKLDKTRSALHRVETGQTKASVHLVKSMMDLYDAYDPTLIDEVREANKASNPRRRRKANHTKLGSSAMPTDQSEVDKPAAELNVTELLGDDDAFNSLLVDMVTDQAPRIFAVVIERGHREDAAITAWGMAFEDSASMVTANGNNHYSLTAPENALNYVRINPHTTPHLIWANPAAANAPDNEK